MSLVDVFTILDSELNQECIVNRKNITVDEKLISVMIVFGCLTVSQSFEPSHQILSENIALAIILPIILVILLIGGIYMYYTK